MRCSSRTGLRDVVVDREPAERVIPSPPLRWQQEPGPHRELTLCAQPGAWGIAITDMHSTMDLGDGQAPLAQLATR